MLSKRLRDLREFKNLKQYEIAGVLNITREAYSLYETGKRQPCYETLCLIADYYRVSVDYLLGRKGADIFICNDEEKRFLMKLRGLDSRGRETLSGMLDMEHSRSSVKRGDSVG